MSFVGKLLGKITGAQAQADAAVEAGRTQVAAAQKGVDGNNAAQEALRQSLLPYMQAGTQGLTGQMDLIGLNGAGTQQTAIDALRAGPQFQSMLKQGEQSILSNASATGGLRGGNTQGALAQYSPNLLSSLLNQQYTNLGGLALMGQNSAIGVGNAGLQTATNNAGLLEQQGAATAGGQMAQGSVASRGFGTALQIASLFAGAKGFGGFGGGTGAGTISGGSGISLGGVSADTGADSIYSLSTGRLRPKF